MTSATSDRRRTEREEVLAEVRDAQAATARRSQRMSWIAWGAGLLVVGLVVAFALLSTRPNASTEVRQAPDFTLPATDGSTVSLSDLRGEPVLLFFSEGAGCDSCLVQMAEIEKDATFGEDGLRVVPIVMNTAEQINADRERFGVETPFLLDDGTVTKAYELLGTGMHEGLPGHGFVLVDADGTQLWKADYPSMWLPPEQLVEEVTSRLEK